MSCTLAQHLHLSIKVFKHVSQNANLNPGGASQLYAWWCEPSRHGFLQSSQILITKSHDVTSKVQSGPKSTCYPTSYELPPMGHNAARSFYLVGNRSDMRRTALLA